MKGEREQAQSREELLAEKREARRRRRLRNQIVSYVLVVALIAAAAAGIAAGVGRLMDKSGENVEATTEEPTPQDVVENILGTEETLVEPDPMDMTEEPTPEQKLDEIVDAAIGVMPLEDKVAGLFLVTPESITGVNTVVQAGEGTKEALSRYRVGGILYFAGNIQSKEQLTQMIDNTVLYSSYPLFIGVDEEGGSVSRVSKAGLAENVGSAREIAAAGDPDSAYQAGVTVGGYLSELGFNLDFAPVADIANVEGSVLGDRAYGADAASVTPYVTAMTEGLQESGVSACLKHFPGIGSSTADTHEGMASTDRTLEEFRAEEFTVFQAGIDAGADMVMVSHIGAPGLTGDNTPCSLSPAVVTDLLRNELGFDGVVITDALNMNAITDYYESGDAAVRALRAGCDMLLMPENFGEAYNAVLQAVQDGTISEERVNDSLRRIYRIKYADRVEE